MKKSDSGFQRLKYKVQAKLLKANISVRKQVSKFSFVWLVNTNDATNTELTNLDWAKYIIAHIAHRVAFKHTSRPQISLEYCICCKHTHPANINKSTCKNHKYLGGQNAPC